MLEVQKFLKENSVEELINQFSIKVKHYPEDGLLLLNYDQLKSPKTHPVVMECRSLILDDISFDIISQKFPRFFNLGEFPESYSKFNWNNYHIMSKEDGSLVGVYYNPNTDNFEVSTRSMAKAEQEHDLFGNWRMAILGAFGFDTEDDFQEYWKKLVLPIPNHYTATFIFEFVSPLNRIVTPYTKNEMVLLGINTNGIEHGKDILEYTNNILSTNINVRLPEFYNLPKTPDSLIQEVNKLENLKEGFVLWDENNKIRIKLKSSAYLVAHAIRGETGRPTRKNILNLILTGEDGEFITYFPEYAEMFNEANSDLLAFYDTLNNAWKDIYHIEDQKEFALMIKDRKESGIYFMAKKQKLNPMSVFSNLPIEKQLKFLGE
jgi:hypothetical protein